MNHSEKPRLIIVAGPNGSGKTTITEKLLMHEWMDGCVYINPDFIARDDFGDWNSKEAVLKAADKAQVIRNQCIRENKSVAFETVFSSAEKLEFVKLAKDAGYFIRLFFICTNDPTINAQRVAQRVMQNGHDVPISKIISRYYKSIENCVEAISLVDRLYFYDNSQTDQDPELLFRVNDQKLAKVYIEQVPDWAQSILSILR